MAKRNPTAPAAQQHSAIIITFPSRRIRCRKTTGNEADFSDGMFFGLEIAASLIAQGRLRKGRG